MISTLIAGIQEAGDERMIAVLSQSFSVPSNKVRAIYREQLRRLAEGARIRNFLGVLAIGKTRSILRDNGHMKSPKDQTGTPARQNDIADKRVDSGTAGELECLLACRQLPVGGANLPI